jgi:hypothetical protein
VILDFLISKGTTVLDVARRVIWRLAQGNVGEERAREGRGRLRLTNPTNGYERIRRATEGYGRAELTLVGKQRAGVIDHLVYYLTVPVRPFLSSLLLSFLLLSPLPPFHTHLTRCRE